jgi:hypothetical protein
MADLSSKGMIVAKGVLFLCIAIATMSLLLFENPSVRVALLLTLLVWSSCRFYYFLFYVLERYVDPSLRYAGLLALARAIAQARRG